MSACSPVISLPFPAVCNQSTLPSGFAIKPSALGRKEDNLGLALGHAKTHY